MDNQDADADADVEALSPRHIHEKLESYDSVIIYQTQELLKAKDTALQLQACLMRQYETLNRMLTQKVRLTKELKEVSEALKPVAIDHLGKKTVHGMVLAEGRGTYVCGSEGLLLLHNEKETLVYRTYTKSAITRLEAVTLEGAFYLVAVSKDLLLVYHNDETVPLHILNTSRIAAVFRDGPSIFLMQEDRTVKVVSMAICELDSVAISAHCDYLHLFPAGSEERAAFVTMQDSSFHVANYRDGYSPQTMVQGPTGVVTVLAGPAGTSVCLSEDTAWHLDKDCVVSGQLSFSRKVAIAVFDSRYLLVVDQDNVLHLHRTDDTGAFSRRLLTKAAGGTVTAASMTTGDRLVRIFVATGDQLYTLEYNLAL